MLERIGKGFNDCRLYQMPHVWQYKIKKVCRKWGGKFRGQTYSIPRLEFHECLACGEKVYDRETMRGLKGIHII